MSEPTPLPTPENEAERRSAALAGELSADDLRAFEQECEESPPLAEAWQEDRALDRSLREAFAPWSASEREDADAALVRSVIDAATRPTNVTPLPLPIRPRTSWGSAVAVAAGLLFVLLFFGLPSRTPKSIVDRSWTLALTSGHGSVWVPAGIPKKVPPTAGEVLDAGEFSTFDRGAKFSLPGGGTAYLSANGMLRFSEQGIDLWDGSLWVRSEKPIAIRIGSGDDARTIRGEGSWILDLARKGGAVAATVGPKPTNLAFLGNAGEEISEMRVDGRGSFHFFEGPPRVAPAEPAPLVFLMGLERIVDRDAREEWLLSDIAAIADENYGPIALKFAIDRHGEELGLQVLRRLSSGKFSREAQNRYVIAIRETMRKPIRADSEHASWVLRLFKTVHGARDEWLPDLIGTLSTVTGIDPIPSLEEWTGEVPIEERRGYLEKWRAVWEQMTGG